MILTYRSQGSVSVALNRDVSLGPWEIETNPNANGGLHNAVKSIEPEMKSGKVGVTFSSLKTVTELSVGVGRGTWSRNRRHFPNNENRDRVEIERA